MIKLFWLWEEKKWEIVDWIEVEIEDMEEDLLEEVWQVALDVLENSECVTIVAPIAWIELEEVDLSLNKTVLTIKWSREEPEIYRDEDTVLRNSECFFGKFIRNVILPENLALNKIKAYMENNLLIITIPKLKFDSQSIKINRVEG